MGLAKSSPVVYCGFCMLRAQRFFSFSGILSTYHRCDGWGAHAFAMWAISYPFANTQNPSKNFHPFVT